MREIRPYGSVRGVRRKPYPYRDIPYTRRRRRRAFDPHPVGSLRVGRASGIERLGSRAKQRPCPAEEQADNAV